MSRWEPARLDELAFEITSGVTPRSGDPRYYSPDGAYAFAKIDDLSASAGALLEETQLRVSEAALRETGLKLYPAGTILLSMYGTVGSVKISASQMTANQALAALLPPFQCDPKFLYHLLNWAKPSWERFKAQTTQANINGSIVKSRQFLIPSEEEQRRIVEALDAIDRRISLTQRIAVKLAAMRQGKIATLLAMDDVESTVRLGRLADVASGVTLGSEPSGPGTIRRPYLRVANVQDGHLDLQDIKYLRVRISDVSRFELAHGDVLMNEGGDADKLGRGTVWKGEVQGCLHQNHVFRVRPNSPELDPEYLAIVTGSSMGKQYFFAASKQTTNLASINSTQIKAFPVPLRSRARQREIVETARVFENLAVQERAAAAKLEKLRSALAELLLSRCVQVSQRTTGNE